MVSCLFFSSYNSAKLGNNMMSTCSFGLFWPDGGQKMAWLQVNSGTLSLRPYPHISLVFWKRRFFSLLSKQSVPTGCFFFQWLKVAPSLMGTMHLFSLVSKSENNDNFLKTSIVHSTAKKHFLKYPLWKAFREDEFSVTLFTGYVLTVG